MMLAWECSWGWGGGGLVTLLVILAIIYLIRRI